MASSSLVKITPENKVLNFKQRGGENLKMLGIGFHWYASVLYKRFLTPFRDDIWNHRQVSVGDRGGDLPTRPRNRRDRPSWDTG